jgi:acetyl-CoA carboxylase biotin carboxyl carrier protein
MAENAPDHSEPLDVHKIHYLVRLMKRYDLTDLNISDGPLQIRLKRRGPEPEPSPGLVSQAQIFPPSILQQTVAHAPASPSGEPRSDPAAVDTATAPKTIVIESPMVGTYYASSAPDAPPFVTVGSVVQPDTTLCIIEAMKVFTDIPAGVSGTIAEILVKNGQSVEFGQPLFRVIPG